MKYTQLTEVERYQIHSFLKAGYSQKAIADEPGGSPSTISREIKRDKGLKGYRPKQARRLADDRKQCHRHAVIEDETWRQVETLLRGDWSPEQITGWLKTQGLRPISPEWIYQHVPADKKRGGDLHNHLRRRKKRKKRYGRPDSRGQLKNRVGIDERPSIVDRRERIGDWETDTVIGRQGGAVLFTGAERKSRYSVLVPAPDKTALSVKEAMLEGLSPLADSVQTLTCDNGKEFALHREAGEALGAQGYFAHPYPSWERGLNENTNGLIRRYPPKGSSFDELTASDIQVVMDKLNNRPRKCLGFKTPNQVMFGIDPPVALAS